MKLKKQPKLRKLNSIKSEDSLFGEVLKTFGANGEVLIKITNTDYNEPDLKEPVYLVMDGLPVPFFFKQVDRQGSRFKVIFENMESEEYAAELTGKKIYTRPEITEKPVENIEIIGYSVIDNNGGKLGTISDFFDYPGNPCIEISGAKTILLPVNGNFITNVDKLNKTVFTDIPEGLIEL